MSKNWKLFYIATGSLTILGIISFIIYIIGNSSEKENSKFINAMPVVGIIFFALALLFVATVLVINVLNEKKEQKEINKKQNDEELLKKYKKK